LRDIAHSDIVPHVRERMVPAVAGNAPNPPHAGCGGAQGPSAAIASRRGRA